MTSSFLETMILVTVEDSLGQDVQQLLIAMGCRMVYLLPPSYPLVKGPLFFSSKGVFRTSRLYADTQEAFVLSSVPSQADRNV